MLSVICPIYNEEKYIQKCIDSILLQEYPKDQLEVIFVDGMSSDRTKEIVETYTAKFPFIKLLDNPKRVAPSAMNIGIKAAKGEVIIRLDAHALYPPNYFAALVKRLEELSADNVGTVCHTDVLSKNSKALAIREALSNKFGVGNSVFRTGVNEVRQVDTVPFGCWHKSVFDKIGLFDERLIRHQDFELNSRIIKSGGKIFIIPDTYCTYFCRDNFKALSLQHFKNGLWNIRTIKFTGHRESLALRHCIPMIFLLSLILPFLAGFFLWPFWIIGLISLTAYLLVISTISFKLSISKKLSFFYLAFAFMTLHISNGCGMLISLFTSGRYVRRVNAKYKSDHLPIDNKPKTL